MPRAVRDWPEMVLGLLGLGGCGERRGVLLLLLLGAWEGMVGEEGGGGDDGGEDEDGLVDDDVAGVAAVGEESGFSFPRGGIVEEGRGVC